MVRSYKINVNGVHYTTMCATPQTYHAHLIKLLTWCYVYIFGWWDTSPLGLSLRYFSHVTPPTEEYRQNRLQQISTKWATFLVTNSMTVGDTIYMLDRGTFVREVLSYVKHAPKMTIHGIQVCGEIKVSKKE